MLVTSLQPRVYQLSYISFGFVMVTLKFMHCVVRISRKYALNRLTLLSLWLVQAKIDLTHIEVVALEEDGFLLSKKQTCPLINQVGDDISTPMNQPSTCAPQNLFGNGIFVDVYKPLDLDVSPKSRKDGRFFVFAHSNYPFCKKKVGGGTNS